MSDGSWYRVGFIVTFCLSFLIAYIYCIAEYGLLLGGTVGVLAAAIVAVISGALWPLIALVIVGLVALLVTR